MRRFFLLSLSGVFFWACGGPGAENGPVRLIDRFSDDTVVGAVAVVAESGGIAWEFGEEAPELDENVSTWGWRAGADVSRLEVRDGTLTGRTTGNVPVIVGERTSSVDERDGLYAVEIRLRVSDGENLFLAFAGDLLSRPRFRCGLSACCPFIALLTASPLTHLLSSFLLIPIHISIFCITINAFLHRMDCLSH